MIREALQYLVGMGKAEIHNEGGQAYSDKKLNVLEDPVAKPFTTNTLSGLVNYLKSEFDGDGKVIVHVNSPNQVSVSSALNTNKGRDYFISAEALIPSFRFNNWYDTEDFNIKLQSCFVKNSDRDVMLKVVGNIQESNVKSTSDDGVSQAVVAKTGVASVGNVEVPNPVQLAPYRTFVEVEQPASDFVFRMQNGPRAALFEADGGKWKLKAIKNIREYLEDELAEEIKHRRVTIIA